MTSILKDLRFASRNQNRFALFSMHIAALAVPDTETALAERDRIRCSLPPAESKLKVVLVRNYSTIKRHCSRSHVLRCARHIPSGVVNLQEGEQLEKQGLSQSVFVVNPSLQLKLIKVQQIHCIPQKSRGSL